MSDAQSLFEVNISAGNVIDLVGELMDVPLSLGQLIKDAVGDLLTNHVNRALDAFEQGDDLGGYQAVAQAVAVSAAWTAGTAFGWSTKLPIGGLDLVFQSFRDQGMMGRVLENFGIDSPTNRQRFLNFTKGMNFGAVFAYGVNNLIESSTNTHFLAAKNWVPPRDPLVLDLDGDGIETVGINPNAAILFDHNANGVKTATGWIKADDGLLVLDRDGNGQIDTGRELFGDATVLAHGPRAGRQAQDGYEALADQDSNADQVLDSTDAAWGQLRVWRDLNQDGISQAGELQSRNAQWPRVSGCGRKYKRNWALPLDRIGFSATEFNLTKAFKVSNAFVRSANEICSG